MVMVARGSRRLAPTACVDENSSTKVMPRHVDDPDFRGRHHRGQYENDGDFQQSGVEFSRVTGTNLGRTVYVNLSRTHCDGLRQTHLVTRRLAGAVVTV